MITPKNLQQFDVAVIGGGPAGMMAAGRAAELGAKVALLEKNSKFGRKLLITGKGRCNITQAEFNDAGFIGQLGGKKSGFLFSSLAAFGPEEVIDFFNQRGLATKIERGKRVFPVSDNSTDVLEVLLKYLRQGKSLSGNVEVFAGVAVLGFKREGNHIKSVVMGNREIVASNYILCCGGKSYPVTGSTGDGYQWARELGHTVIAPAPALAPIATKETWVKQAQGCSLKNVRINIFQNGKKQDSRFGEMLFTHFGISGPIALDVSKRVGELQAAGSEVKIMLDLKPALDDVKLDQRLRRDFEANLNKDFKNYLPDLLPKKLIGAIIGLSGIDPDKKINLITKEERRKLARLLKGVPMTADAVLGFDQAIITSGGVDLKEIDSKTMRSKIIDNLFFAGEIIDLDGPTGGYNLQICWSTGYAAGTAVGASRTNAD